MRALGLLLLFFSVSSLGVLRAGTMERGLKQEEAFLSLLGRMRMQISCYHRPLDEIYAGFSGIEPEFDTILRERGLEAALTQCGDALALSSRAAGLMREFAAQTGKSDASEQVRLCEETAGALRECLKAERAALPGKKRVCLTLSLSGAAMAVLLCL